MGVAGRLSGTVSNFRAEQGPSLETPSRARASSCQEVGTTWFFSSCGRILELRRGFQASSCVGPGKSNHPEVTFSYHMNTCLKRTTMSKALEKCSRSSTFWVTGSINLCASNSQRASVGPKGVTSSLDGPITSWEIDGETAETVRVYFFLAAKSLQMVAAAMKLKDT